MGIVTRLVSEEELLDRARTLAVQLVAGPTKTLGGVKRLMHSGGNETLETQMEDES